MPKAGADPGFFLGGGALVSSSTSTPINHIVFFFLQNTSCIRKPQVISSLHPPPRSAPAKLEVRKKSHLDMQAPFQKQSHYPSLGWGLQDGYSSNARIKVILSNQSHPSSVKCTVNSPGVEPFMAASRCFCCRIILVCSLQSSSACLSLKKIMIFLL